VIAWNMRSTTSPKLPERAIKLIAHDIRCVALVHGESASARKSLNQSL